MLAHYMHAFLLIHFIYSVAERHAKVRDVFSGHPVYIYRLLVAALLLLHQMLRNRLTYYIVSVELYCIDADTNLGVWDTM